MSDDLIKAEYIDGVRAAAEYLGIKENTLYGLRSANKVPYEIGGDGYHAPKYRFKRGELDKWKEQQQPQQPVKTSPPEESKDPMRELVEAVYQEEDLLHEMMRELFKFLRQFDYELGVTSMRKVTPQAMQLWVIETPDIGLHVVQEGGTIHLISPQNQKYLELVNSELLKRLKSAETTLAFMRKHPIDFVLTEYSEEILVQLEPRENGFLLTCKKFPMIAAIGPTEEEVIKTFKGLLFGYTYHLRTHEEELTPAMRELFVRLKGIRAEV